jgi:hypothetical protein
MKLSEVCHIISHGLRYYNDRIKFVWDGYLISLGSSMPDYFRIEYLKNELEEFNNDLKELQELIFKLN